MCVKAVGEARALFYEICLPSVVLSENIKAVRGEGNRFIVACETDRATLRKPLCAARPSSAAFSGVKSKMKEAIMAKIMC